MEYDSNANGRPAQWMSMRRLAGSIPLDLCEVRIGGDAFCACETCLRGTRETYNAPTTRDAVRTRLTAYRAGWYDHYPHGTGRATFYQWPGLRG